MEKYTTSLEDFSVEEALKFLVTATYYFRHVCPNNGKSFIGNRLAYANIEEL